MNDQSGSSVVTVTVVAALLIAIAVMVYGWATNAPLAIAIGALVAGGMAGNVFFIVLFKRMGLRR